MKRIFSALILMGCCHAAAALADDFPASYIRAQLLKANNRVDVDLAALAPGKPVKVDYVDAPVWIYRRTAEDLEYLRGGPTTQLADPEGKTGLSRSPPPTRPPPRPRGRDSSCSASRR